MGMNLYIAALDADESAAIASGRLDPTVVAERTHAAIWNPSGDSSRRVCSMGKLWHAVHFVLTGSAWETSMGIGELILGGEPVGDDLGYGPARFHAATKVAKFDDGLAALPDSELRDRFSTSAMADAAVMPNLWDEPEDELWNEVQGYVQELRPFLAQARADGLALFVVVM